MEKRISKAFGKKVYLLAADEEALLYWVEEPLSDCG